MGKLKRPSLAKKNIGIFKLKLVVEKVQKSLLQAKKWGPKHTSLGPSQEMVPEDVKEGHFAIIAVDDDEEKRFVVPLVYLGHPSFQRLLERAAEEYGFNNEGALMVPCRPSELECMLDQRGSTSTLTTITDDIFPIVPTRSGFEHVQGGRPHRASVFAGAHDYRHNG